jgi:hypothetical protein
VSAYNSIRQQRIGRGGHKENVMQEMIIKPEGSTPVAVYYRIVRKDEIGEYVLLNGRRAYIVRKDGRAYVDYYMDKK